MHMRHLTKYTMAKKTDQKIDVEAMRHSCSHVLAQAVLEMFPEAKLAIGPSIENGFYYDFDLPRTLIPEDLPLIEKKMKQIFKQNQKFVKRSEPIDESIKMLKKAGEIYKAEMASDLKVEGEKEIDFYENVRPADEKTMFVDMCRGPHVESTGKVGVFKLTSIAGAYWKGDEKNKMLQRIYGVCFPTREELDEHLRLFEEAKKRDHRRIGKDQDLFSFHEEGPGFPFFHPKGMRLKNQMMEYWFQVHKKYGYDFVETPIILNEDLWHRSGHYENYKENMYFTKIDEGDFAVKPMNCPGHILIYKNTVHSYRDLPYRWAELGLVHRHEMAGVLHGLFRVRSFTQDDAHVFCREDQMKDELKRVIALFQEVYEHYGFTYKVELSTRPDKSIGSDKVWETSEKVMKEVLEEVELEYELNEGDGAFYGPKFDFHLDDCLGRTWQCGTIQLDFSMPQRFEISYVDKDGKDKQPVMIHRACYGSLERFLGIVVENYGGAFPVWLAPVQARILSVSEKFNKYAKEVGEKLNEAGLRFEIDDSNESLGKKIRNAELQKIPYMLVVGEKEVKDKTIAVRDFATKKQDDQKVEAFVKKLAKESAA
ncbi:threonine--tRNA ligase [Candidatus Peregrinibacteria bacterium]|jgi:threonyl-tRNA synthetase|nr:threonine--tRNA ligase [Candidatus Peregrinibacteria bacterium]MBT4148616.1 threonine--tRNA ligase [Candidatus Peregrinibacteria bacterium]MBT4366249.1 threonine--tRNA ligase [Candidatus Peregrinibacteria bacterium]MBT4455767.1 threonine--tRNA ligase [Candidatus Peregrinibacteria bacterium]